MNEAYSLPGTGLPGDAMAALGIDTSEFIQKIYQYILKTLYDSLYKSLENSFNDLFSILNTEISNASSRIYQGPKAFGNGTPFAMIQKMAENVCIPIAAAFITVIFCWELIHLVQESNSMNHVKPDKILLVLLKFGLCLLVCAKSFDIIMGFYDVGAWASAQLGKQTSTTINGFTYSFDLSSVLLPAPEEVDLGMLMTLCGYKIMVFLSKIGITICGVIVYVRIMLWFLEILLYAAAASIPYSTWINKEWSQVGMNYTRKMLALAFEGFFMLLLFSMYGGVVAGISHGDFMQSMVMIIGCGFALAVMMFKTGNISASIFNAH